MVNMNGPATDPCGTEQSMSWGLEMELPMTKDCLRTTDSYARFALMILDYGRPNLCHLATPLYIPSLFAYIIWNIKHIGLCFLFFFFSFLFFSFLFLFLFLSFFLSFFFEKPNWKIMGWHQPPLPPDSLILTWKGTLTPGTVEGLISF